MSKLSRFLQSRVFWIQTISISLIALCLVIGLSYAWNAPTQSPPNGNISAPLNVGATTQTKAGGLNISGKVGIGTTNPGAKLDVAGQVIGGFGAQTTGGTLDWNNISNARSGSGYTLLKGNATNGPGPGTYFHSFNFEYSSKNGSGNITQFAIPYGATSHMNSGLYMRGRYSGAWSNWMRIIAENNSGNVGIGTINPGAKLEVRGGNINIPVNAISFNAKTNSGTAGMGNTDTGSIYGEHNSGTENSRLVIDVHDNTNDAIVLRSSATSGGSVRDMVYVDNNKVALVKDGGKVGIGTTNPAQKLHINGNIRADGRHLFLGSAQDIYGDNSSAIYYDSNYDTVTQMIFRDKQNTTYGRVYGSGNGANFGLLDGNGHWSYLAAKNNYTQFRINNSAKMTIKNNGNVGIGTTNPGAKLDVEGGAIKAGGGLIIETRTSDPSSPKMGQIWLRTDL
ncbi:MAG TPA: hypothetical protein ENL06_02735 [Candidatus Portnoybacteria bacterium]|nr:hypothetical protein [Candidatus Portnoybacteria bacterium]